MVATETIIIAFALTLFAGLSTVIGSTLAFFTKTTKTKFLSLALGFSAGVMIYVAFVDIFNLAKESLISEIGIFDGTLFAVLAFFGGILVIAIIDRMLPSFENPHEIHRIEEIRDKKMAARYKKLYRIGIFTALVIAIHNFPEGIVTFASTLTDIRVGISIAIAIAIHNIPEGIAVSIPIFYATRSKGKAFLYSALAGFAEPVGALIAFLVLSYFLNGIIIGILLAAVAGIMIFISLDELLPAAREYGEHHLSMYGLILGMLVMAISLVLFL